MYSILAIAALVASVVADQGLPVPRNMCGTKATNVSLSPVLCAIAWGPGKGVASVTLNQGEQCTPAFCSRGTSIKICRTGPDMNAPISVSWTDIVNQVETAFGACGAVTRDDGGGVYNAKGDAKNVPMRPFSYIAQNYQINVEGNDCGNGQFPDAIQYKC